MVTEVVKATVVGLVTVKIPVSCVLQPFLSTTLKVGVPGATPVKTLLVWVVTLPPT